MSIVEQPIELPTTSGPFLTFLSTQPRNRDDAALFKSDCFCGKGSSYNAETEKCSSNKNKMDGWNEYWLDLRTPACLTNIKAIQTERMKKFKAKGCDGVDPDNVDSVSCDEAWIDLTFRINKSHAWLRISIVHQQSEVRHDHG